MKIRGSVALVTGANRGLGLAFAKALLERGAKKVYAAARNPASVTLPGVVPVQLDVTSPESIAKLAAELRDVSLLINNAGISTGSGVLAADAVARAREEMEANYLGPLAMTQAFAPTLAEQGGGAIINVLSALAWVSLPRAATYSASKSAAWGLTNGIRSELKGQHTQVVGLHVGFVDTDLTRTVDAPKEKPEDVIRRTLDGLEAGQTEVLADEVSKTLKQNLSNGVYLNWP